MELQVYESELDIFPLIETISSESFGVVGGRVDIFPFRPKKKKEIEAALMGVEDTVLLNRSRQPRTKKKTNNEISC